MDQPTLEEIAYHYAVMLDPVAVIKNLQTEKDSDEAALDTIDRNKSHLKAMLAKGYWTDQDFTAVEAVVG